MGSLISLGLKVDVELLKNLDQIPKDSFFVQLIKYFSQFSKPGKSENADALGIHTSLCNYVSSELSNSAKVLLTFVPILYLTRLDIQKCQLAQSPI